MITALKFFILGKDKEDEFNRREQLLSDIRQIKKEIDRAYSSFENCCDDELIEASIYELDSLNKKYQMLIKTAKKENLQCDSLTSLYALDRRRFV